jgi:hypothetical protein
MKRNLFCLLPVFFIFVDSHSQRIYDPSFEGLYKFTDGYFRSDPFKGDFNGFLEHLVKDPGMTSKNSRQRTDSSLYSFHGIYTSYNPFFFKPNRIEIQLKEASVQYHGDSSARKDTIFIYQLLAFTQDNPDRIKEIDKEFERIHRRNKTKFFENEYKEVKSGSEGNLRFYNYYLPAYLLAPVSIIKGKSAETHELFLNITLRFKRVGNVVTLPAALNRL